MGKDRKDSPNQKETRNRWKNIEKRWISQLIISQHPATNISQTPKRYCTIVYSIGSEIERRHFQHTGGIKIDQIRDR